MFMRYLGGGIGHCAEQQYHMNGDTDAMDIDSDDEIVEDSGVDDDSLTERNWGSVEEENAAEEDGLNRDDDDEEDEDGDDEDEDEDEDDDLDVDDDLGPEDGEDDDRLVEDMYDDY